MIRQFIFLVISIFVGNAYAERHDQEIVYSPATYWYAEQPGKSVNPGGCNHNLDLDSMVSSAKSGDEYFRNYRPPEYQPSTTELNFKNSKNRLKSQIARKNEIREQIKNMDFYPARFEMVESATEALKLSKQSYLEEDFESGEIAGNIADHLLDLAISVTPVVGWWRDLVEAVSGKDLITGEELGSIARAMSVVGVITGGFGSKPYKALRVIEKITKSTEVAKLSKHMLERGHKIWTQTKSRSHVQNAYHHFDKHGYQFPEFPNALRFVEGSYDFMHKSPAGTLTIVRSNGEKVFYHPQSNIMAIQTKEGIPKTMYKPELNKHGYSTNLEYFHAQHW